MQSSDSLALDCVYKTAIGAYFKWLSSCFKYLHVIKIPVSMGNKKSLRARYLLTENGNLPSLCFGWILPF